MIHVFGPHAEWELDEELWELRRGGKRERVQPKVLALLFHLARNADRVVPSAELLRELWPNEVVTSGSLARAVSLARTALAKNGADAGFIITVPRRGYRFRIAQEPRKRGPRGVRAHDLLVGRDAVLQELREAYRTVLDGSGRIALLRGDAGIGKTRLIEEITRAARADGVEVLAAWCSADSGQPPLWPWARIAREALVLQPRVARRLGARIAAVRELADPTTGDGIHRTDVGSEHQAAAETFKLVDALVALLRALSGERPLVVALDDLQWADRASLRALALCARDLRDSRVLVIGSLRDDALPSNEPLQACLAALESLNETRTHRLGPLTRSETAALVRELWGKEPPESVLDSIWNASVGNPLFARELVRHLLAGGSESMPLTVKSLFDAKLARLGEGARELLRVATLVGAEPDLALVRSVLRIEPEPLAACIGELAEHGLAAVASDAPLRLRFAHPLVRETVLANHASADRLRLHAAIARELETLAAADPDSMASELAEHLLAIAREGGDTVAAAEWSERAARVALRRCAYDDAARGFARSLDALRLTKARDSQRELSLLLSLGDAYARANQLDAGADASEAAAALARRLDDAEALARASLLVFVRGPESGGPYDRVLTLLEEAEVWLRGKETPLRARVCARLANELFFKPHTMERRVALADEARKLVATGADVETRLFVGYHTLIGTWSRLRASERVKLTAQLTELADASRDPSVRFMVSGPHIASLLECGRVDLVDAEIESLSRRVESLEVPSFFAWYPHVYRGMRALLDGRYTEAERLISDGRDLGVRAQTQDALRNHAGQYTMLLIDRDRVAEAEPALRSMQARFRGISIWRAVWLRVLASVGKLDEARQGLHAWVAEGLPDPQDDTNGVISLHVLASVAAELDDVFAAKQLFLRLSPYSGECAAPAFGALCLGPIDLPLAQLARALGRGDQAVALAEAAERTSERMGSRPLLARSRLARAEALRLRAHASDHTRARELAASAAALADSLGMPLVSRRAAELR